MKTQLEIALSYAKNGIRVFPCNMDKKPMTKNGFKDASYDVEKITKWFDGKEDVLIGAPNDQFTVIDIDDYDICKADRLITDHVINELWDNKIFSKKDFTVTTMSGGTHKYFKHVKGMTRKIGILPNIDLCGDNGYTILPDQKHYVADKEEPWDAIKKLPKLDEMKFDQVVWLSESYTVASKILKSGIKDPEAKDRFENEDKINKAQLRYIITELGAKYSQENSSVMYSRSDVEYVNDPYAKILNEEGKIRIEPFSITDSAFMMNLFHNREVQIRLATHLGLKIPEQEKSVLQHSIFPKHVDKNPSMGVRWDESGSHLIVRDFANFHGDRKNNLDFNLVRLYTTVKQKTLSPRLTDGEFLLQCIQLMDEAGILDIDYYAFDESLEELSGAAKTLADGFVRLASYRRLFKDWDGFVAMTQAFGSMFCGLSPSTVSKAKVLLRNKGYLTYQGHMKTNPKSDSLFYTTEVYGIVTDKEDGLAHSYWKDLDYDIHQAAAETYHEVGLLVQEEMRAKKKAREEAAEKKKAAKTKTAQKDFNVVKAKPETAVAETEPEESVGENITDEEVVVEERVAETTEVVDAKEPQTEEECLREFLNPTNVGAGRIGYDYERYYDGEVFEVSEIDYDDMCDAYLEREFYDHGLEMALDRYLDKIVRGEAPPEHFNRLQLEE